jgi:hemolysin III
MGDVLYAVGVIFHLWRSLPYQNAIRHALYRQAPAVISGLSRAQFLSDFRLNL